MTAPTTPLLATARRPLLLALALAIGFFGGFGAWSALTPLTSAAVAPGFIGVETRRKTVQHLEGGIIAEIAVREGQRVEAGDLLLLLDDTVARSTRELLEGQYVDLLAEQARLVAERVRAPEITFAEPLTAADVHPRAAEAMEVQRKLFESRQRALASRTEILERRIDEIEEQLRGFRAQADALGRQRALIRREEAAVSELVEQGLERTPRLLGVQRALAETEGAIGEITSRMAQARVRIGETRVEILDLETRTVNQVTGDLRDVTRRIADMQPRLRAAQASLDRTEVRAPEAGTVVALQFHTVGGVVPPGGRILDMVPADAAFVIEAQVSPSDIDVVRPGLPAEVRLTAFSTRITPSLPGTVTHVSAYRLVDPATRQPYYAVYVRLDPDSGVPVDLGQLYPGMPVEVMVVTGERTALDYLLRPITDTFARAFRES